MMAKLLGGQRLIKYIMCRIVVAFFIAIPCVMSERILWEHRKAIEFSSRIQVSQDNYDIKGYLAWRKQFLRTFSLTGIRLKLDYVAVEDGITIDPKCDKVRLRGYDEIKSLGKPPAIHSH